MQPASCNTGSSALAVYILCQVDDATSGSTCCTMQICSSALPTHDMPNMLIASCWCRDVNGTGDPPFSVFVGDVDASTAGSYTVLDNTNCTAYPVQFTANSEVLAVPCTQEGRYVVIKATGGPLVLCEVLVYGKVLQSTAFGTQCHTRSWKQLIIICPGCNHAANVTTWLSYLNKCAQCAGYTPDSSGAATESAGNDVTDLILTTSCTTEFTYTGAGIQRVQCFSNVQLWRFQSCALTLVTAAAIPAC